MYNLLLLTIHVMAQEPRMLLLSWGSVQKAIIKIFIRTSVWVISTCAGFRILVSPTHAR